MHHQGRAASSSTFSRNAWRQVLASWLSDEVTFTSCSPFFRSWELIPKPFLAGMALSGGICPFLGFKEDQFVTLQVCIFPLKPLGLRWVKKAMGPLSRGHRWTYTVLQKSNTELAPAMLRTAPSCNSLRPGVPLLHQFTGSFARRQNNAQVIYSFMKFIPPTSFNEQNPVPSCESICSWEIMGTAVNIFSTLELFWSAALRRGLSVLESNGFCLLPDSRRGPLAAAALI